MQTIFGVNQLMDKMYALIYVYNTVVVHNKGTPFIYS